MLCQQPDPRYWVIKFHIVKRNANCWHMYGVTAQDGHGRAAGCPGGVNHELRKKFEAGIEGSHELRGFAPIGVMEGETGWIIENLSGSLRTLERLTR